MSPKKTQKSETKPRSRSWGQITEEELQRLLERKGVPRRSGGSMQRGRARGDSREARGLGSRVCSENALAFGDTNPLYHDRDYATKSIWGQLQCPPGLLAMMELVNGATDGFPGCHTIWRGCELQWERPLFESDSPQTETALTDAYIVDSKFGGGKAAIQNYESKITNRNDGGTLGFYRTSWHRFSRSGAKNSEKYANIERAQWTDEDLEGVWDEYRRQNLSSRRGSEPLYWEDVKEDTDIPYLIKGPTTLTSKLAFEIRGAGGWVVGHELAMELWDRYPNLAIRNEENVPEPPVSIHWTNERCQKYLGMPGAYEAGYERLNWLTQMQMHWIGDHGMLRGMDMQFRGFHWQGDVIRLYGHVTNKEVVDGKYLVNLDIETRSHRDEVTTKGTAVVQLPSRDAGTAVWPPQD